jgi:TolB protein
MNRYSRVALLVLILCGCGKDNPTDPGNPPGNPPPGGSDGKIAFVSSRDATQGVNDDDLYLMNPDGSNIRRLTNINADLDYTSISPDGKRVAFYNASAGEVDVIDVDGTHLAGVASGTDPCWSPTSSRIVFSQGGAIKTMNPDGSGVAALADSRGRFPSWSPVGGRIAYVDSVSRIVIVNEDGSNRTVLPDSIRSAVRADWSPDGSKLVFALTPLYGPNPYRAIVIINADGSGYREVPNTRTTNLPLFQPSWSPDGGSLAFARYVSGSDDIYVIKADGTGLTNISNAGGVDSGPDWGP